MTVLKTKSATVIMHVFYCYFINLKLFILYLIYLKLKTQTHTGRLMHVSNQKKTMVQKTVNFHQQSNPSSEVSLFFSVACLLIQPCCTLIDTIAKGQCV